MNITKNYRKPKKSKFLKQFERAQSLKTDPGGLGKSYLRCIVRRIT